MGNLQSGSKQKEMSTHACVHGPSCVFPLMRALPMRASRHVTRGGAGGGRRVRDSESTSGLLCRRLNSAAAAESGSSAATPGKSQRIGTRRD